MAANYEVAYYDADGALVGIVGPNGIAGEAANWAASLGKASAFRDELATAGKAPEVAEYVGLRVHGGMVAGSFREIEREEQHKSVPTCTDTPTERIDMHTDNEMDWHRLVIEAEIVRDKVEIIGTDIALDGNVARYETRFIDRDGDIRAMILKHHKPETGMFRDLYYVGEEGPFTLTTAITAAYGESTTI